MLTKDYHEYWNRTPRLRVRFINTYMKICTKCSKEKPESDFYKNSRMKDGFASSCKRCCDGMSTVSRSRDNTKYAEHRNNRRKKVLSIINEWKGQVGCQVCGEDDPICLDLHHVNSDEKDVHPSALVGYKIVKMLDEFKKCVLVCKNCHAKIHHGNLKCPSVDIDFTILENILTENIETRK